MIMLKDRTALLYILLTFATGLCGSFFYPLSSLFLVEGLGASPVMLSAYMVLAVFSSVVVTQFIAHNSDKGWRRKTILLVSFACYFVTVTSFAFIRNYYAAVAIAILFGSVSGAIYGQIFAMGREYADNKMTEGSTSFLSTMRAGMAVAWVFGPPLAFIFKGWWGFSVTFLIASAITVCTMLTISLFLYEVRDVAQAEQEEREDANVGTPWYRRPPIVLFTLAMLMTFSANNLYITVMPLYLSQELVVEAGWVGTLFGFAALCEIPIMLGAGWLSLRYGAHRVLTVGLLSGAMFYFGLLHSAEIWQLMVIQVFNGVFIGVAATLGMVVLQDLMRDQLGVASTLFSNVMQGAVLVSSLAIGFVGQFYDYFSAFYLCLAGIVIALVLLWMSRPREERLQSTSAELKTVKCKSM
ncbi:sugar efflux transporter [Thaumasiovibrio subtropicus]|uniref:sugar efflux transporter n=1 Tax=Thaumasiovibrio subtropicus TaxID=1891207 RepID=UPI000B358F93|nr:sugar efflux transporter [Thaumasiovibrio subtropicus]